jgi:hypothetical protein
LTSKRQRIVRQRVGKVGNRRPKNGTRGTWLQFELRETDILVRRDVMTVVYVMVLRRTGDCRCAKTKCLRAGLLRKSIRMNNIMPYPDTTKA